MHKQKLTAFILFCNQSFVRDIEITLSICPFICLNQHWWNFTQMQKYIYNMRMCMKN